MASIRVMPWGRYRGHNLDEIPASYLCWCLESADALSFELRRAITAELGSRFNASPFSSPFIRQRKPCPDPVTARELIAAGLHTLARKHHPDVGGNTAVMQTINSIAGWLREIV